MSAAWLWLGCTLAIAQGPAEDPHGAPDGCPACHLGGAGADGAAGQPGPALPSLQSCVVCHADVAEQMHAVGRTPTAARPPADWPLESGRIACATCHAEPSCAPGRNDEPPYHRGGPYVEETGLCYACHDAGDYLRQDPHHPERVRAETDPTCAACHVGVPPAGASGAATRLRTEPLCQSCHEPPHHVGAATHLGQVAALPDTVDFPLAGDGTIACWTCHEVHGEPLAESTRAPTRTATALRQGAVQDAALSPSAVWPGDPVPGTHDPLLVQPLADGALCRACHGEGP